MSAATPMRQLARFGHKPHRIDRKKYGQPRVALYYANRSTFSAPGLYVWTGKRNVRALALPRHRTGGAS